VGCKSGFMIYFSIVVIKMAPYLDVYMISIYDILFF